MDNETSTIGERIKLARNTRKLSQEQLAVMTGISKQAIHGIEVNKTRRSRYLKELSDSLGTNFDWVLSGQGDMFGFGTNTGKKSTAQFKDTVAQYAIPKPGVGRIDKELDVDISLLRDRLAVIEKRLSRVEEKIDA